MLGRVDEMVDHAAIATHRLGNRRYHNLVLLVVRGMLVRITDVEQQPDDPRKFVVFEECDCGVGYGADPDCPGCGGSGEVRVERMAPKGKTYQGTSRAR